MKRAQLIVAGLAVMAGFGAFMLSGSKPKTVIVQAPVAEAPKESIGEQILVITKDVPIGTLLDEKVLAWKNWPKDSLNKNYVQKAQNPKAIDEYKGAVARYPLTAGEPISITRVAKKDSGGVMAALLPKGKRAIAMQIDADKGAGGFILPNDRVDILLTRRERSGTAANTKENIVTETLLPNIRVLAIDQTIQEKEGEKVVVGRTATLELTPTQVETLSRAKLTANGGGELSLALRSLADADKMDDGLTPKKAAPEEDSSSMTVVRFGVSTQVPVNR